MSNPVIIGTDGSSHAEKALEWASDIVERLGAELLLVHVFDTDPATLPGGFVVLPEDELRDIRLDAEKRLNGEWSRPARNHVRLRTLMLDGSPAGAMIDLANKRRC